MEICGQGHNVVPAEAVRNSTISKGFGNSWANPNKRQVTRGLILDNCIMIRNPVILRSDLKNVSSIGQMSCLDPIWFQIVNFQNQLARC